MTVTAPPPVPGGPLLVDATPPRRGVPWRLVGLVVFVVSGVVVALAARDAFRDASLFVAVSDDPPPPTAVEEAPDDVPAAPTVDLELTGDRAGWAIEPAPPPTGLVTAEPVRFAYFTTAAASISVGVERGGEVILEGEPEVVDGVELEVVRLPDGGPVIVSIADGDRRVTWRSLDVPARDAVSIAASLLPTLVDDDETDLGPVAEFLELTPVADLERPAVATLPAAWSVAPPDGRTLPLSVAEVDDRPAAEVELRLRGYEPVPVPGLVLWRSGGFDPTTTVDDTVGWFHPSGHLVSLTGVEADDPVIADLAARLVIR